MFGKALCVLEVRLTVDPAGVVLVSQDASDDSNRSMNSPERLTRKFCKSSPSFFSLTSWPATSMISRKSWMSCLPSLESLDSSMGELEVT